MTEVVTVTVTVTITVTVVDNGYDPLVVSGTNPRYFTNDTGLAIPVVGSHTWDNGQDRNDGAFDWDTYLDNLESWGHNWIRYWVWESPTANGSPNLVAGISPLSPIIWNRSATPGAADGGNKWDLTSFNTTYFNRLRQRAISAGQRGIYVSVMLFNGWSVADKGGGADPWPYHPMEDGNNVNSIDGDTNNDGDGFESQDDSIPAITTAQKAYIDEVLAAVDDLDNVMYEICNEPDSSSTDWIDVMIAYIQANSDKPILNSKVIGVADSYLTGSNAEAISPGSDVTMDGTKVVIVDTDHYFGIGGDADWAWSEFADGAGGVAYMDSYNNDFLDNSPGHPIQNLRDNLGYIRALATYVDLIVTQPQGGGGSPCATGYCLYGSENYICYQPNSGNFNLDLSGESGTFNVRKVNRATGAIDTAQTVDGGATRSITQPGGWTSGWACAVYK